MTTRCVIRTELHFPFLKCTVVSECEHLNKQDQQRQKKVQKRGENMFVILSECVSEGSLLEQHNLFCIIQSLHCVHSSTNISNSWTESLFFVALGAA